MRSIASLKELGECRDKRSVLITGACGFIGSHLAEAMVELGANVRAFCRYTSMNSRGWLEASPYARNIEFVHGDIRDPLSVEAAMRDVEVVFHLAALVAIPFSYDAPHSYISSNINGTLNVLNSARRLYTPLTVITSSSEVYGTAQYVPIDEAHPLQAQSPYAASKIGADKLAESFWRSFGTPITIVRPFNTFGPRQSARAVIPTIVTQALVSDEIRLGALTPTRDMNFVDDTVRAFVVASQCPLAIGETLNFGSGREVSIGDLANIIRSTIGRDVPIVADAGRLRSAGSEVERLCANSQKARELTGWSPRTTLSQGIETTIEWVEANLERFRVGQYAK